MVPMQLWSYDCHNYYEVCGKPGTRSMQRTTIIYVQYKGVGCTLWVSKWKATLFNFYLCDILFLSLTTSLHVPSAHYTMHYYLHTLTYTHIILQCTPVTFMLYICDCIKYRYSSIFCFGKVWVLCLLSLTSR